MKRFMFAVLCIITTLLFTGCNPSIQISYDAYNELIRNLETMGYTVEVEDVEKSILSGERKWLTLNGSENISVYLYKNRDKMEKDASYLSDDGYSYNDGKKSIIIEWVSYPHFFKSQNMIVLYVGENSEIVNVLEKLVGPQFAGKME